MEKLINKIETLNTKEDFVSFLELLVNDLRNNQKEWENKNLESYLEAAASWTEDMDGYYKNNNLPIPQNVDWKVFAHILIAAKMYEQLDYSAPFNYKSGVVKQAEDNRLREAKASLNDIETKLTLMPKDFKEFISMYDGEFGFIVEAITASMDFRRLL